MPALEAWKSRVGLALVCGLLSLSAAGQTPASTLQVNDLLPGQTQLTPAQMPPKPPEVSFQNGELTVTANNSTLSSILHAVEKTAGIKLQGTTPEDRLFGKFGPGSPRDVITQLFSGSHIDYILQGNDNPESVTSITINNRGALNADMFAGVPPQPPSDSQMPQNTDGIDGNGMSIEQIRGMNMRNMRHRRPPLNSETAGGQEPENTNGYSSATDQSGPEENGYQPVENPPPPTQQQLLDRLHQMQQQQQQGRQQQTPPPDPM